MSDNAIAKHVGVAQSTVSDWRQKTAPALKESLSETQSPRDVSNAEPQKRLCVDGRMMNTANIGRRPEADQPAYTGGTRVAMDAPRAIHPAPPPPEPPKPDRESITVGLLRSIFDLAEHRITAKDLVDMVPAQQLNVTYEKSRAAFEFVGFVMELAAKRQKGVA